MSRRSTTDVDRQTRAPRARRMVGRILALMTTGVLAAVLTTPPAVAAPGDHDISVSTLDFGYVHAGVDGESSTLTVVVSNLTSDPLPGIDDVDEASDVFTAVFSWASSYPVCTYDNSRLPGQPAVPMPPGSSCTIRVSYTPTDARVDRAVLQIDGDSEAIGTVDLVGTGYFRVWEVSTRELDFGDVEVGSDETLSIEITNRFTSPVAGIPDLSASGLSEGASPFTWSGDSCSATTIAYGDSCSLDFTLSPTEAGAQNIDGLIRIDRRRDLDHTILLTGNGIENTLAVTPALDFGDVEVGTTAHRTAQVTNISDADQMVTAGVSVAGNDSGAWEHTGSTCIGVTLPPGGTCVIGFSFAPAVTGADTAVGQVQVDGRVNDVVLSAAGVRDDDAAPLTVSPTELSFGEVPVGEVSSGVVTVTNTSAATQSLTVIGGVPTDTNFSVVDGCAALSSLAPGGTCTYDYYFVPSASGEFFTLVDLNVNGVDWILALKGIGVTAGGDESAPALSDLQFDYDTINTDEGAVTVTGTITATDDVSLSGAEITLHEPLCSGASPTVDVALTGPSDSVDFTVTFPQGSALGVWQVHVVVRDAAGNLAAYGNDCSAEAGTWPVDAERGITVEGDDAGGTPTPTPTDASPTPTDASPTPTDATPTPTDASPTTSTGEDGGVAGGKETLSETGAADMAGTSLLVGTLIALGAGLLILGRHRRGLLSDATLNEE